MEYALAAAFFLFNIIVSYFFKNNIFDLILRFIQNINKPLDFIIDVLEGSQSSITLLSYRKQIYNFVLVIIAIIMILSEFGTLQGVLSVVIEDSPLVFLGYPISLSTFSAIAYITIATLLGFLAFELISFRKLFQNILYNDVVEENTNIQGEQEVSLANNSKFRYSIAFILGGLLLALAIFQGQLSLLRYELTSNVKSEILNNYSGVITSFNFTLGFLTPIVAALALLSFDIFIALIAKTFIKFIEFIQKIISCVYLALEALIELISAPIVKLLELFKIYQKENMPLSNAAKITESVTSAPLQNHSDVYKENIADIYRNFRRSNKLTIVCNYPSIRHSIPSPEFPINEQTKFSDLSLYLEKKYDTLKNKNTIFQFVDASGSISNIDGEQLISEYLKITNSIFIHVGWPKVHQVHSDKERVDVAKK